MKTNDETTDIIVYDTFQRKTEPEPEKDWVPYAVLILCCIGALAQNFCYENPIPFQTQIEESLKLTTTEYNMLFSFYYLPNIFMPLLIGYLADVFGRRFGLMLSSSLIFFGHLLFAIGISGHMFVPSVLGRLIFGIGAESYIVVILECLSFWNIEFLSFSMGIQSASQRLGSALNDFMLPQIYEIKKSLPLMCWIGLAFGSLCLITTIIFSTIEYFILKSPSRTQNNTLRLSRILTFPALYWVLTLYISFNYLAIVSLNTVSSGMLQARFGFSVSAAGTTLCIPLIVIIIGNPFFGFIIDRVGHYSVCCFIGSTGMVLSFAFLTLLPDYASSWLIYLWALVYGASCSLIITASWPGVKLVVPEELTSTAYGLSFSIQDGMLFLGPVFTGVIVDTTKKHSGGYFWASIFFLGVSLLATVVGWLLIVVDNKGKKLLRDTPQKSNRDNNSTISD